MLVTSLENNYMSQSIMCNQYNINKCGKQFCTIKQARNDTLEQSHRNAFCKNNNNLLVQRTQNDLLQEQIITQKTLPFSRKLIILLLYQAISLTKKRLIVIIN